MPRSKITLKVRCSETGCNQYYTDTQAGKRRHYRSAGPGHHRGPGRPVVYLKDRPVNEETNVDRRRAANAFRRGGRKKLVEELNKLVPAAPPLNIEYEPDYHSEPEEKPSAAAMRVKAAPCVFLKHELTPTVSAESSLFEDGDRMREAIDHLSLDDSVTDSVLYKYPQYKTPAAPKPTSPTPMKLPPAVGATPGCLGNLSGLPSLNLPPQ